MNREEIYKELQLTYGELVSYLLDKYGGAVCDYFATPECRSKSKKASRTSEGLYCHHIDEDKGGNLSDSQSAILQPFEWQRKERLVYCNVIEHLIMHIKIAIMRQKKSLEQPSDVNAFFTTGGVFRICEEINDMFINSGTSLAWKRRCFEEVKDNYEDYIVLIMAILSYIDNNYVGTKNDKMFLEIGNKVVFSDCECEIIKINKLKTAVAVRTPSGEEKVFKTSLIANRQLKYADCVDIATRKMSQGYNDFYEKIYNDIIQCDKRDEINNCVSMLKVDYNGYGYAQYADIKLSGEFGAKNADEYLSKAFPMHCELNYDLKNKSVEFWRGPDIPQRAKNTFFVVRMETMFTIKQGRTPFVRYREIDPMRSFKIILDNNNNLKDKGWTILSTSDIYDKKTDKYYSQYIDVYGNVRDATVVLTLGREDYFLFKEQYDIRYLKVLDGCYFYL